MTVLELKGILNEAIERGCGELPVIATINYDASTEIQDCAYGDVYLAYPFSDGKVFAITAIKGGFPEALIKGEWDVCLPDGEVLAQGTRDECTAFIAQGELSVNKTDEEFCYFEVAR